MVKTIPYESNTDGRTPVVTTSPSVSIADEATSSVTIYVSNYVTTFGDIGNNLISMSSNESNTDATPALAVMVEPYNMTYDEYCS